MCKKKCLAEEFLAMGEEWQRAVEALIGSGSPSPKQLADMLRGDKSIPTGVRELLAELLDPGEPEYLFLCLELKSTKTEPQRERYFSKELSAALLFGKLRWEGKDYNEAIAAVKKRFILEEKTTQRSRRKFVKLEERLHGKD
jgi:hypothetical protein